MEGFPNIATYIGVWQLGGGGWTGLVASSSEQCAPRIQAVHRLRAQPPPHLAGCSSNTNGPASPTPETGHLKSLHHPQARHIKTSSLSIHPT